MRLLPPESAPYLGGIVKQNGAAIRLYSDLRALSSGGSVLQNEEQISVSGNSSDKFMLSVGRDRLRRAMNSNLPAGWRSAIPISQFCRAGARCTMKQREISGRIQLDSRPHTGCSSRSQCQISGAVHVATHFFIV